MTDKIVNYLKENRDTHLKELTDWLAVPSVSALPEHKEDVRKGAEWIADNLKKPAWTTWKSMKQMDIRLFMATG